MNPADPTIDGLRAFLDASPSPFHAVDTAAGALGAAGFTELDPLDEWPAIGAGFVRRGGAVVAWRAAAEPSATAGFRIVGAHTDSPGLRVKPQADTGGFNFRQLAVEVYGGALLNSWLDRDLGVAGLVVLADGSEHRLLIDDPIARIPQLAIHLDREVNERGVQLDKQVHLQPVWGTGPARADDFRAFVAGHLGVAAAEIVAWDLQLFDVTPSALLGADRSLLASGRLDNQLSCWAALAGLLGVGAGSQHQVIALFDHEEVGSASTTGAAGPLLEHVLDRLVLAAGGQGDDRYRALAASSCISADNAHAVHPNYPERHEPGHRPIVNQGPALKINANQRYATSASTAARFRRACDDAGVPMQTFVSRNTMPCGSTIGPITATRLGIDTVDVGVPQLSMHSARELCGTEDPVSMTRALAAYFSG